MMRRRVTLLYLYYPLLAVDVPVDIDDGAVKMVITRQASVSSYGHKSAFDPFTRPHSHTPTRSPRSTLHSTLL